MQYGEVMSNGLHDSSSVFLLFVERVTLRGTHLRCLLSSLGIQRLRACSEQSLFYEGIAGRVPRTFALLQMRGKVETVRTVRDSIVC